MLEERLSLARESGLKAYIPSALHTLGFMALTEGDDHRARELCEESLRLARETGNAFDAGWALRNLGLLAQREQDDRRASALYRESLTLFAETDTGFGIALALMGLVQSMGGALAPATAAQLLGAAAHLVAMDGEPMDAADQLIIDQLVAATRAKLDDAAFATAWAAGQALSMQQVMALAESAKL